MDFAKAKFVVIGERGTFEGVVLIDSCAWYTVIDRKLADEIGVRYSSLTLGLILFSGP